MSVQYRAIWQDNNPHLLTTGSATFQEWLHSKELSLELPDEGRAESGTNSVRVSKVDSNQARALRIRLDEIRTVPAGEERWSTTAHLMTDGQEGWVWIDLEWVSHNIYERPPKISAPNLVGMLLASPGAELSTVNLGPTPITVGQDDLVDLIEWLYDRSRSIPVVVYTLDETMSPNDFDDRAGESARRLTGCADVRILTREAQVLFHKVMNPDSLSVFGGAVRIYFPDIDKDNPQPWRHRYILSRSLPSDPFRASRLVIERILPRTIAQQPPDLYRTHVGELLGSQERDWQEYAMELDDKNSGLEREVGRLKEEKADVEDDRDLQIEEAIESEKKAQKLSSILRRLRDEIRRSGISPDVIEQDVEIPDPSSCSQAINEAAKLDYVAIHPDAPQDIDEMDRHEDSELWGRRIYAHLQALNSYAEHKNAGYDGGLWEWCENSGHDDVITASKFVAMKESQYVRTSDRLMRCRLLPIHRSVDPNGFITMESHLKPIQGGGLKIPRIYFHDDTRGLTRKIHIGFIGPHELMPNKSTG